MHWLTLVIAIIAEVIGTSALKEAEGFTKLIPSLVVAISYAVAFYCLSLTVKTMSTSIVYAVWSGAGVALICTYAWVFKGEKLDLPAIIGVALIVSGVIVINIFSKMSAH